MNKVEAINWKHLKIPCYNIPISICNFNMQKANW